MKATLDDCVARLGRALEAFPFADKDVYADWCAQTYFYVRHSTRLLAASASRFAMDELGDALHLRFAAHMGEEKRHERLALHDLGAMRGTLERFPERPATRAFWEPQYYKVEHEDPIVLFGYILALEAMSAKHGPAAYARVVEAHGAAAATFLKVHAQDDEDHLAKALAMLERVDDGRRALIEQNIVQSTFSYLTLLVDLRRR